MSTDRLAEVVPISKMYEEFEPTFDIIERPRELPTRPRENTAVKPLLMDVGVFHPGHGLEPQDVVSAYRQAECGFPQRMFDMFDDVTENDGSLRSLQQGRVRAVAGKDMTILPGIGGDEGASLEAAEALRENIRDNANFFDMAEHQVNAVFPGFAATEIGWRFRDGLFRPDHFINVPERRFVFDPKTDRLRLLNSDSDHVGEELRPGQWIVTRHRHRKLARAGLMTTLTWFALFKRMAIRDWIITMEKFGIPFVIGKYDEEASKTAREIIDQAVEDVGEDGHATIPEGCSIDLTWAQTGSGAAQGQGMHQTVTALCNAEMAKLVNGATLTTESGGPGSFALGKVHENREFSLVRSDARMFEQAFVRDVAAPFVRYNGFTNAAVPRLVVQITRDMDPVSRAGVAKVLAADMGLPLSAAQLYEEFGFRAPSDAGDEVKVELPDPNAKANEPSRSEN